MCVSITAHTAALVAKTFCFYLGQALDLKLTVMLKIMAQGSEGKLSRVSNEALAIAEAQLYRKIFWDVGSLFDELLLPSGNLT